MFKVLLLVLSLVRLLRLTSAPAGSETNDPPKPSASDTAQRFNGDQIRMAEKINDLEADNYKTREKVRERDTRIKELEAKQVPDGAVVLTGDDAKLYQDFRSLNLKPDEVQQRLKDADEAVAERDQLKRSNTIREVADVTGYKATVLERLGADLTYEVKDVTESKNGKSETVKRAFVKVDGKDTPLSDYAKQAWPDFLPALTSEPVTPERPIGTPRRDVQQRQPDAATVQAPAIRL